ncbi:MAG: penicillin-binding transpeptidase domain-containing protein, partial [Chloroflexota bacterium]|nr:penicillin-binding transpeptidase domain-containing protein [Chloroflexota bacterium]
MTRVQRGTIRLFAALALIGVIAIGIIGQSDHLWLLCMALAVPFTAVALWRGAPRDEPLFNRTSQKLAHILLTLFVLLSMQLVRAQVVTSGATQIRTEDTPLGVVRNPRVLDAQLQALRGEVFSSDGVKIVGRNVASDKTVQRTYPDPVADYLVGYYNPVRYGTSNLEYAYNAQLSGRTDADPAKALEWSLLHQPAQGNDLILTLNAGLQQQATNLLGNRNGSIVLLDAKTGAVLAMVSNPHLDPAGLAAVPGNDPGAYWDALRNNPNSPFVLRPTQGLYTPGSIFKTITAAAAIDAGKARPDTTYEDRGFYNIEGYQLTEQNIPKGQEGKQSWTLQEGYQWSLNVVYAQVGAQTLGGPLLSDYTKRFGFGEQIPFDLGTNASRVSDNPAFLQSGAAVAQTAFGQGQLLATPLQMALVAACMANDGKEMEPYLVASVRRPDGTIASEHTPTVWKEPIRAETAVQMRAMMENSVANGYANTAAIPGV